MIICTNEHIADKINILIGILQGFLLFPIFLYFYNSFLLEELDQENDILAYISHEIFWTYSNSCWKKNLRIKPQLVTLGL